MGQEEHAVAIFVGKPLPVLLTATFVPVRMSAQDGVIEDRATPMPVPPPPPPNRKQGRANGAASVRVGFTKADIDAPVPDAIKMFQQFQQVADEMGPFVMSLSREPEHFAFEARQMDLVPGVAHLTNWLLEQYYRSNAAVRPVPPPAPDRPPELRRRF